MNWTDKILSSIMLIVIGILITLLVTFGVGKNSYNYLKEVTMKNNGLDRTCGYHIVKRILDILISSISLVLLSPFMLIIALLIKIEDGHCVTYKTKCVGYKGDIVSYRKFRTIKITNDIEQLPIGPETMSLRISKVGKFLRMSGLDYTPMLVAVFLGKLTIIGLSRIMPEYITPSHKLLFDYEKPGILGLSSISHYRLDSFMEDELLDKKYIEQRSIRTDILVLMDAVSNTFITSNRGS